MTETDGQSNRGPYDRYVGALAVFGEQVQRVEEDQWFTDTPAKGWTVSDLVAHVVIGEAQIPAVLAGDSSTQVMAPSSQVLGSAPMAAWRGTALRAIEAVNAQTDFERELEVDVGTITLKQLLSFRVSDNLVHAWDLSKALGDPIEISDEMADWLLEFWQPVAGEIAKTGQYAPPLEPSKDASPSQRLLALLGRDINWRQGPELA